MAVAVSGVLAAGFATVRSRAAQPVVISYFIADGTGQTGFHSSDPQLARWALEAWQRSAPAVLRFEDAPESGALIRLYWTEPNDGRYGETQPLSIGGRRGAAVFIQPSVVSLDEGIARRASTDVLLRDSVVYLTCLHEIGHALGLAHTRDFRDIMYFFGYGGDIVQYFDRYRAQLRSRGDIAAVSGLSDGDVARLRAIYP
jgi:matrixin